MAISAWPLPYKKNQFYSTKERQWCLEKKTRIRFRSNNASPSLHIDKHQSFLQDITGNLNFNEKVKFLSNRMEEHSFSINRTDKHSNHQESKKINTVKTSRSGRCFTVPTNPFSWDSNSIEKVQRVTTMNRFYCSRMSNLFSTNCFYDVFIDESKKNKRIKSSILLSV